MSLHGRLIANLKSKLAGLLCLVALQMSLSSSPLNSQPTQLASGSLRIRPGEKLVAPELRYRLLARFGEIWFCDPDSFPVARANENEAAIQAFPEIAKDADTLRLMTKHLGLKNAPELSDDQKILLYREYKKLSAIRLEPSEEKYKFSVAVRKEAAASPKNGWRFTGFVDQHGQIEVLTKEPAFLTCPICLAGNTLIDTPEGPMAVKDLRVGMLVWTLDGKNQRVARPILKTARVEAPTTYSMVHLVFADGRDLWVSAAHPTVDGRTVGELRRDGVYDGANVTALEIVPYDEPRTYDLLPAGDTGFYWANGILLDSTLHH